MKIEKERPQWVVTEGYPRGREVQYTTKKVFAIEHEGEFYILAQTDIIGRDRIHGLKVTEKEFRDIMELRDIDFFRKIWSETH